MEYFLKALSKNKCQLLLQQPSNCRKSLRVGITLNFTAMNNYFGKALAVFMVLVALYACAIRLGSIVHDGPVITAILTAIGLIGVVFYEAYIDRKLGSDT